MEFSLGKCKTLHFGRGQAHNLAVGDEHGRHVLKLVTSFEDLGALHSPDIKDIERVDTAVAKGESAIYLIGDIFR